MAELTPGDTGYAELVVAEQHLANSFILDPSDDFPPVLATAQMIALMEVAGSRIMHQVLSEGELSVGVTVDVNHTAPTPLGDTVRTKARFIGMDGKFYLFEVIALDSAGEIGRGFHKRAVVNKARIIAGAAKRLSQK